MPTYKPLTIYKPYSIYNFVIDYEYASPLTGFSKEVLYNAVNTGELKTINKRQFRIHDLSAWVEEQRFRNVKPNDVEWKKYFYEFGYAKLDVSLPDEYAHKLLKFFYELEEGHHPHVTRNYNYTRYIKPEVWRYVRLFNLPQIDEIIYNWKSLHEIGYEIYGDSYSIDNIAITCHKSEDLPIAPHVDLITVLRDKLHYPTTIIGIDLTDVTLGDGGLLLLPKSHRIMNGRGIPFDARRNEFIVCDAKVNQVKMHTGGTIHATQFKRSPSSRVTLYISLVAPGGAIVRTKKYNNDNIAYVFRQ